MKKSHNYYWLCYHVILRTKYNKPFIQGEFEPKLYRHMISRLEKDKCAVLALNGHRDHVHLLFYGFPSGRLSELVGNLEGSTSRWVNKNALIRERFSWQNGFKVFSAGKKEVRSLVGYIREQKEHHIKMSTSEEIRKWEEYYSNDKGASI